MEMEKGEGSSADEKSKPWQSYHTVYTNAKAGMDGVDKEKVQRIVYEMSKGSKYFENEERKEALMKQKIANMKLQYSKLTELEISHYQMLADKRILELEATRDLTRIWLHVDMDAFYAAVETLSNPSLKGKPMAVGGMSMISTANYEARKFGVRAAMPGFIARKLCPELVFVPTDFKKYTHYSDLTRKVFQKYDPNFVAASLDEAYLDITEICKERNISSGEIADELRSGVYEETGLTCSAGVGPNRLLAKVCSDINKPNGQFVLPNDRSAIIAFISSLPIRKIGGIGKVTECILRDVFGINTCAEILEKAGLLSALFSQSSSDFFLSVGLGLGGTDTPQVRSRKSISNERTFPATDDESLLYQMLEELADKLSADMGNETLKGRTLTLKLKTASFEVRTRAVTLQKYIYSAGDILNHALKLLKAEFPVSVRLMGLRMSHFEEEKVGDPTQKTLADFITTSGRSRSNDSSMSMDRDLLELPCEEHEMRCQDFKNIDYGASSTKQVTQVIKPDRTVQNSNNCPSEVPQVKERDPFRHSEDKRVAERDEMPGSSCSVGDNRLCWVNDYKCSICGIELPPSFIEERQEHSDFHLAEQLQCEESSSSTIAMPSRSCGRFHFRTMQRETNSRSKRLKPSSKEVKHVPIDMYFSKSN